MDNNTKIKITSVICTAVVLVAFLAVIRSCQEMDNAFRENCVKAGGSVVGTSNSIQCIQINTRPVPGQ